MLIQEKVPYSYAINATGHSAIRVPLDLKVGIQIVGQYYSEPELLHLAKLLEPLIPTLQKLN